MGCLASRRVWFYLLYPRSNNPCNSFNCFFLHFKRNQTNCYELYLSSRFYRIYTFNDICILHVVLVKATPDRLLKNLSGLLFVLSIAILDYSLTLHALMALHFFNYRSEKACYEYLKTYDNKYRAAEDRGAARDLSSEAFADSHARKTERKGDHGYNTATNECLKR